MIHILLEQIFIQLSFVEINRDHPLKSVLDGSDIHQIETAIGER